MGWRWQYLFLFFIIFGILFTYSDKKMRKYTLSLTLAFAFVSLSFSQDLVSPEKFFGFVPGSDGNVFRYEKLIDYLKVLDTNSERLSLEEVGKSPMGKPMYIAFISAKENLEKLETLKKINKDLAINTGLSVQEKQRYIEEGKVFVMATMSMHSTEVGPAQSVPLIGFDYCTTEDPDKLNWLNEVVLMIIPNHNPDGMNMIVDYYNKTKDTKYEGASYPGVYHKYVGHDNNRDFVILSQEDTKVIAKIYNTEWYPQVFVEKHQMGSTGVRYFVPPNHDPIAENIDEGIWNWTGLFGANLIQDMTNEGHAGVSQNYLFDNYWPGSTETCIWKNVIGFLTEAASARIASPVYIDPTELRVSGKGLSEYKKSNNLRLPWPGGEWRLSDIVNYEITSIESIMKTSCLYKKDILKFRNDLAVKQVKLGKSEPPFYYILPLEQHDQSELVKLVHLLDEHGIDVYTLNSDLVINGEVFTTGDIVIPMSQPYRSFIKEVMEKQEYPERHYTPGGDLIKPYDIASWSLPLHNGLISKEIRISDSGLADKITKLENKFSLLREPAKSKSLVFSLQLNESYEIAFKAASAGFKVERTKNKLELNGKEVPGGSFVIANKPGKEWKEFVDKNLRVAPLETNEKLELEKFEIPEIALVESYFHDMDAGWTRFVLDSYGIPYTVMRPADFKSKDLSEFNVIIFPNESPSVLVEGKYKSGSSYSVPNYAPEFTKGMEKEGKTKLMEYIHNGGNVVAWGESTTLFEGIHTIKLDENKKEDFNLPFSDISGSLIQKGLYCPGSLIRLKLKGDHEIIRGMPEECGVFYRGKPVFQTRLPYFDMGREVIGVVPEKDILMSGYSENEELLGNKALLIALKKGQGNIILMGFNPQFRSSTHVTYKLLFNSILL